MVLNCDSNTALEYAIIKNQLRKRGCPIPENDIWIAALAKQYNITLITRDKHFNEIKDVNTHTWKSKGNIAPVLFMLLTTRDNMNLYPALHYEFPDRSPSGGKRR